MKIKKLISDLEIGFTIFSLIYFTNILTVIFNQGTVEGRSTIARLAGYLIQFITFALIVAYLPKILRLVRNRLQIIVLLTFLAYIFLSFIWSDLPISSLKSLQNLLRITLFGVYFGTRYTIREQLNYLAWALGIGAVLSIFTVFVFPGYGIMGSEFSPVGNLVSERANAGTWKGVYGHKNSLGRAMVLGSLVFITLCTCRTSRSRFQSTAKMIILLSLTLIALVLIVGSSSKTSIAMFVFLLISIPVYTQILVLKDTKFAFSFFLGFLLLSSSLLFFIENYVSIVESFGRDPTLTGRLGVWQGALQAIQLRPVLGYGYGGFWDTDYAWLVWDQAGWFPKHSHNGFLDLLLDLGWLGFLFFLISYFLIIFQSLILLRRVKSIEACWPILYMTFFFVANLTESSIFRQNFTWIIYVALLISVSKSEHILRDKKLQKSEKLMRQPSF
jgi:O-antigen ligase